MAQADPPPTAAHDRITDADTKSPTKLPAVAVQDGDDPSKMPGENRRRDRCYYIGGMDARIIIGDDERALLRLWREMYGAARPPWILGTT